MKMEKSCSNKDKEERKYLNGTERIFEGYYKIKRKSKKEVSKFVK